MREKNPRIKWSNYRDPSSVTWRTQGDSVGTFWHPRYFDRAMRTVKEYRDALEYMHFNPVKKGLVKNPEDWPWSSFHAYGGPGPVRLRVDLLDLPAEETTRL